MDSIIFPIPVLSRSFALGRGALSITLDLACFEPEVWIALVADGKDEQGAIVGYLRLERRITLQPGLTTYAAVEVRPPHDPPPNPASFQTLFQWPSLAVYESLLQSRSALHG